MSKYVMQARSSGDGQLHTWLADAADYAAAGYAGPGSAQEVAVLQRPPGSGGAGAGDVIGPASAVDGVLAAFDGVTGKLLKQASGITTEAGNRRLGFSQGVATVAPPVSGVLNNWIPHYDFYGACWLLRALATGSSVDTAVVTGIGSPAPDEFARFFYNANAAGGANFALSHQSNLSLAANRIVCSSGTTITLAPGQGCWLFYVAVISRWLAIAPPAANNNSLTALTPDPRTGNATLALSDVGKALSFDNASALQCTVPPNSSVAFPVGTVLFVAQGDVGQLEVVAGAGVTIQSAETLKLRKRYSSASLLQIAADTWRLSGDLELA